MGATANAITVTWLLGIGVSAILSSIMLLRKETKDWSDKKIVGISLAISVIITGIVVFHIMGWEI